MAHSYESSLHSLKSCFDEIKKELRRFETNFSLSKPGQNLISLWIQPRGVQHLVRALSLSEGHEQEVCQMDPPSAKSSPIELGSSFQDQPQNKTINAEPFVEKWNYTRGPYRSYTTEEKDSAVRLMQQGGKSVTQTSRLLRIPCKNIKRWIVQGTTRKKGGGRRSYSPKMEAQTYEWILNSFVAGDSINVEDIQAYALSRSEDSAFKASRGWAKKFILRFNLKDKYILL